MACACRPVSTLCRGLRWRVRGTGAGNDQTGRGSAGGRGVAANTPVQLTRSAPDTAHTQHTYQKRGRRSPCASVRRREARGRGQTRKRANNSVRHKERLLSRSTSILAPVHARRQLLLPAARRQHPPPHLPAVRARAPHVPMAAGLDSATLDRALEVAVAAAREAGA